MKLSKVATQDAARWARAEMFFGEGAGTRRKLLGAEIEHKMQTIPSYEERFLKAIKKQDMAEHAIKAAKERRKIDRTSKISKNTRSILRGDRRGLSTGLGLLVTGAYFAHQTGLDKVALEEAQLLKVKIKAEYEKRKNEYKKRKANRKFNLVEESPQ